MTEDELANGDVFIEEYGGGFIIVDYSGRVASRFGIRFRGVSAEWRDQPVIADPFPTRAEAIVAALAEIGDA